MIVLFCRIITHTIFILFLLHSWNPVQQERHFLMDEMEELDGVGHPQNKRLQASEEVLRLQTHRLSAFPVKWIYSFISSNEQKL